MKKGDIFAWNGKRPFRLVALWDASEQEIAGLRKFNEIVVARLNYLESRADHIKGADLPMMPIYRRDAAEGLGMSVEHEYTIPAVHNGLRLSANELKGILNGAAHALSIPPKVIRPALKILMGERCPN